jgi:purine-binding chemotaxis protein CheW
MTSAPVGRVVVCRVGNRRFTVPVGAVREVVVAPDIVPIPGVPPVIRGVVNVRGVLVTVISGAMLVLEAGDGAGECLLLLDMHDGRVAIELDEVEDLHMSDSVGQLPKLDIESQVRPLFRPEAIKA